MMPPLPPRLKEYSDWVKTLPKEPLEVTLALSSPVLQERDGFIHLDSLIYHAILSKVMQDEWAEGIDRGGFFLPIFSTAFTQADERGFKFYRHFYLSSAAKFIDSTRSVAHLTKHIGPFQSGKGKIDTTKGEHKATKKSMIMTAASSVKFWCYGNKDEIAKLLSSVSGIGKKVGQGYGRISSVDVRPVERDLSLLSPEGTLNRVVPEMCLYFYEGAAAVMGYRPPYYRSRGWDLCVLPGAKNVVFKYIYLPKDYPADFPRVRERGSMFNPMDED